MDQAAVARLVERVRRRLRLTRSLETGVAALVPAGYAAILVVVAGKVHWLAPRPWLLAVAAVPVLAAVVAALRRIAPEAAAKQADDACGLADRMVSALSFAREPEPDAFMQAQMRDAARHAERADARVAVPLRWPRTTRTAAIGVAAAAVVALIPFPERHGVAARTPQLSHPTPGQLEAAHELARDIAADARNLDDPELQKLAEEVQALLRKYESGEISRKELFEKLAELEQKYQALQQGDFEALKDKLRQAGEALAKEKPTEDVGKGLKKDDLDKAAKEMQELAKKLEGKQLDANQQKQLERALANAADKMKRQLEDEQRKQDARERALEQQKRELEQMARDQPPKSEAEKRRLEDQRRELEKLSREQRNQQQQNQQNRRQLERLQRSMSDAAQQMSQHNQQGASQSMQQSSQQMSRMASEMRRAGEAQRVRVQMMDLKEMIRRADNGQGKDGKGKDGKGGKMGEFLARAGGKPGQKGKDGEQVFMEGEGQEGEPQLLLPGMGKGNGKSIQMEGSQGDTGGKGGDSQSNRPGDGIGDTHDPNLMGDKTNLAGKKREVQVDGKQGQGPTRSEVIYGAADQGFSQRSYKRVYTDYSQVVEEAMSREQVPLGMRYYVKRYFNLIKPRE